MTPMRPFATARRNPAAKTILRSRSMLALEELRRAAAARLGDLESGHAGVVANVGAHVLREQVVDEHDVVVGDGGVKRGVAQSRVLSVEIRARVGERLHCEKSPGQ